MGLCYTKSNIIIPQPYKNNKTIPSQIPTNISYTNTIAANFILYNIDENNENNNEEF